MKKRRKKEEEKEEEEEAEEEEKEGQIKMGVSWDEDVGILKRK